MSGRTRARSLPERIVTVICSSPHRFLVTALLWGVVGAAACTRETDECTAADAARADGTRTTNAEPDLSGCKRTGIASFYAKKFSGRKMADGTRMDPGADNAASTTLPLGTTAKVTNLDTGQSAEVTIQDRGPYVNGRIIDLSPSTAREIGLDRDDGLANVVVAPIELPLPDGPVKKEPRPATTRRADTDEPSSARTTRRPPTRTQ